MLIGRERIPHDGILYAFYDLAAAPNSYDVLVFLVLAEIGRREVECEAFHLYVVPGPKCGLRSDANVSELPRQQYTLRNVILSAAALMPTCCGVTLCSSRESVERLLFVEGVCGNGKRLIFPPGYSVHFPLPYYHFWRLAERWQKGAEIHGLQPTEHGLELIDGFLRTRSNGRKVITLTLRESTVHPERNSSLREWESFVATLDAEKYAVVVLRDLERMHEPLPAGFARCLPYGEAVVAVELRAALYHRAYLNLCVNNGPSEILRLDRQTRYLYFKPITRGVDCTSAEHHRRYKWLNPGDQLHFATPFQRIVWKDDRAEVVAREFASMVELIESGEYATPAAVERYLREKRERWMERYSVGWANQTG